MTPNGRHAVRVLVADDDVLYTEALMLQLGADDRLEVVGRAADGSEAVALADALQPDLILMDLSMPRMAGVEATQAIRERHPDTLVLILAAEVSTEDVRAASEAGAAGFLTKDVLAPDIASAILELAAFARLVVTR